MNMELQQRHREKRKLKREIIQLPIKLKSQIGLILFKGVIYSLEKSIKQKSLTVTKRHKKKLVKLPKDKRVTFVTQCTYSRHTNFDPKRKVPCPLD